MVRRIRKVGIDQVSRSETKDESRLENDPRFLRRLEQARASARAGRGIRLEDIEE
jgi:hypothetical protein